MSQRQHFDGTSFTLQLHKFILSCTFSVSIAIFSDFTQKCSVKVLLNLIRIEFANCKARRIRRISCYIANSIIEVDITYSMREDIYIVFLIILQ